MNINTNIIHPGDAFFPEDNQPISEKKQPLEVQEEAAQSVPLTSTDRPESIQNKQQNAELESLVKMLTQVEGDTQAQKTQLDTLAARFGQVEKLAEVTSKLLEGVDKLPSSLSAISSVQKVDASVIPALHGVSNLAGDAIFVVTLAGLVSKASQYRELTEIISQKEANLKIWEQIQDEGEEKTTYSPEEAKEKILELRREISELSDQANDIKMNALKGVLTSGLSTADNIVSSASFVASLTQASTAAADLAVVAKFLGVAGAAVGGALHVAGLVKDVNIMRATEAESSRLIDLLKSGDLDPAVSEVIELRLDHLEKITDQNAIDLTQHAVGLYAAGLGGIATTTGIALGLTGATVGVVFVSATGVGAGIVAGGMAVAGLGYAAYKNKENISLSLSKGSLTIQEKLARRRGNKQAKVYTIGDGLAEASRKQIQTLSKSHYAEHQRLKDKLVVVNQRITTLQNAISAVDSPQQRKELANEIVQASKFKTALKKEVVIQRTKAAEVIGKEVIRESQLLSNINKASRLMDESTKQLQNLGARKASVVRRQQLVSLSQEFAHMTPEKVEETAVSLERVLKNNPESKAQVKQFLRDQQYSDSAYEGDPIRAIFKYLTTPARE
ncbi:MAG: hypothetical protein Q8K75_06265 [Chlamydiales bacterium]|nr:hypothetical protein [Chlamydiales bacterium]